MTRRKLDLAWAAGLFEGEGSFYSNVVRKQSQTYSYPCAEVHMTDEEVVRRFAGVIGFGKVWPKKARSARWKPQWAWRCHGARDTTRLVELIGSWLSSRRKEAAARVLAGSVV